MIEAHGLTDPGRKRKNNEDAFHVEPALGLAIVADGMGGHLSGEVAAGLAVETVAGFVARAREDREVTWPLGFDEGRSLAVNCLLTAIKLANRRVVAEAAQRAEYAGMGTTVVAALADGDHLTFAGVGDSRIYLVREAEIRQLTRDDSWLELALGQRLITREERAGHPLRNVLTKAVGLQEELDFDVGEEPLAPGDAVLLCSDGLSAVVPEDEIAGILRRHATNLAMACRALVAAANEAGGPDNVTVVVLRPRDG